MAMIAHFAPHHDEPHELTRRIAADFDRMPWAERRVVLQALPLPDLTQLARVLVANRPAKWRSPDLTYAWLRIIMEPMPWDIKFELHEDGPWYVAYWAGLDFLRKPAGLDVRAANLVALDREMQEFFTALYPRHLIDVATEVLYAA